MSTEIKMKKTKTSLVNGKSYLILNFVDEAGNKYHMPLEVIHMFNDEYNAYVGQLHTRALEVKRQRETID